MGACCPGQQIIADQSHNEIDSSLFLTHHSNEQWNSMTEQIIDGDDHQIILSQNSLINQNIHDNQQNDHHHGIPYLVQLYIALRGETFQNTPTINLRDFLRFLQMLQQSPNSEGLNPQQIQKLIVKTATHNDFDCPICQDSIKMTQKFMQLPCKHPFHPECIQEWLQKSNKCPTCRGQIQIIE